jgi:hypothetical protein
VSSVLPNVGGRELSTKLNPAWLLALGGFAAMYVPLYWWASQGIWQTEEQGHGAIILAVMV